MTEQSPESQEPKEKLNVQCWNCEHNVQTSIENTHTYVYTKQPYFTNTQVGCLDKHCGAVTVLFHDQMADQHKAISIQYPTSIEEYCDDDSIHQVRRKMTGAEDVKPHELSRRAELQIEHWGEFLQKVIVDETDFGINDAAQS